MSKIFLTGGSGFIGTNLIDDLLDLGHEIVNFDKSAPIKTNHSAFWIEGNIMNREQITSALKASQATIVIHLAARTDTLSDKIEDYKENIEGTANVLFAIQSAPSIERAIITSTQYVYKSDTKIYPSKDDEYAPHTVYGQSKVMTEKLTHEANLSCIYTIVRPTNIWGPWHMRYPNELWKVIDKGMYFHPVKDKVLRTYGFVKNITHQMIKIMTAEKDLVDGKAFYVGDQPIDSYTWLNELSVQLTGKSVRRLPKALFQSVAMAGDVLRRLNVPFPLYSERFKNMIEDYPAPTAKTVELFGQAESDLSVNVKTTISWLKGDGKEYFEYWSKK